MSGNFVDRKSELKYLERKWKEKGAQLIVLYGRRRIGKTTLLKEFIRNKKGIYFLATADSIQENIKELREKFAEITNRDYFREINDFSKLFIYLSEEMGNERFAVILDEFQYLMYLDKGLVSKLQKIWDEYLRDTGIFLVLCGSSVGMMEKVLEYKNPLYGRRTGQWKLEQFNIKGILEMFRDRSMEEIIKIYSVFGGVPFYLDIIKEYSVEEAIREKVLRKGEILYQEPEFLLREELRETKVYKLILKGIALGYNTLGKLANFTSVERGHISKYLDALETLDLIEYELPYGKKKRGRYYIKDNFFNFWFRFVYPNLSDLELGLVDEVWGKISNDINSYYGRMFEKLIKDLFKQKIIDFGQVSVNTWWHKGEEIDVVLELPSSLLFVEVKWSSLNTKEANKILEYLKRKAEIFKGNKKFLLVAKKIKNKTSEMMDLRDIERYVR